MGRLLIKMEKIKITPGYWYVKSKFDPYYEIVQVYEGLHKEFLVFNGPSNVPTPVEEYVFIGEVPPPFGDY